MNEGQTAAVQQKHSESRGRPKSSARKATAPNVTTNFIGSSKALNCFRVILGASELSDMCTSAVGLRVSPSNPVDFEQCEKLGSDSKQVLTPHRPWGDAP